MSGGPCYKANQNQIIGVHSASHRFKTSPCYATIFTHKVQELINCAKQYIPKKRKRQPPKKKLKKKPQ